MSGYVPPAGGEWARAAPIEAGFEPAGLAQAVAFAEAHDSAFGRDLGAYLPGRNAAEGENGTIVGPTPPRGGPNGLILRGGRIVAEWGDTARADMTFSVTKSYLSALAGIAFDGGLIEDLDRPAGEAVEGSEFEGAHNGAIIWRHLLQQTSEWRGTLWGKPDSVDHFRDVLGDDEARSGELRELSRPGGYWEYNDVRVNVASLALLRLFRRPLPEVACERLMAPMGCSDGWQWNGYETSWTEVDGRRVQSVSGGGHWGGGLVISARDQARFGLLYQRGGIWGDRRLLSERWIAESIAPCNLNPTYGFMWWLNTDGGLYPSAPAESVFALGAGGNVVWVDAERELVAVIRWIDEARFDEFAGLVVAAMEG